MKLDCGGVIIELTTAPAESLGDAVDAVLSRTEALSRLFQAIDELDGGELTLTPASPSTEDILASDDTLEAVDWIVEKGSADPAGMEPGRMGRLEYDRDQVIKLWAGVLQCGLRLEARVPLAMLLPQLAAGGYTFREDVDLAQTLKRWDSRLLITDDVLSIAELRLWFED